MKVFSLHSCSLAATAVFAVILSAMPRLAIADDSVESSSSVANMYFNRDATFYVCTQTDPTCNNGNETVAEIVSATTDGMTLLYTDGAQQSIGMVDITDPLQPVGMGLIDVGGEPTSVVVVNDQYAIAAVNTAADFVNVSGQAVVLSIADMSIVRTVEIGGQPDAIAVSPDGAFVAIAIENERDEDLNDGAIPQLPAGNLIVMDISDMDNPANWSFDVVDLTNLDNVLYPTDPEPEYVAINEDNICVVTLQENNALVLVDLATLQVTASFSAGAPLIDTIDVEENGIIEQTAAASIEVPREPDAVTWIGTTHFATANEGDLEGGSRGFSIFNVQGEVVYDSGNTMEWWTVRIGQYPEERSENKGNEPEGILYAEFGETPYLFVLSERSSVIFVYTVEDVAAPVLVQILPAQSGPEGVVAIPERNLLIVASEVDERENKLRSTLNIYQLGMSESPFYPTFMSGPLQGDDGPYIPFSALSCLASDAPPTIPNGNENILYSVEDSFYNSNRMFIIDVSSQPAMVTGAIQLSDAMGTLADALEELPADLAVDNTTVLVNEDQTVNLDLEGISKSVDSGFWIVSEGSGTMDDEERPYLFPNMLLKVSAAGVIEKVVFLPESLSMVQLRFGFEGVAEDGNYVVAAMQRAWDGEPNPRLAVYNKETGEWTFVFYPLDEPESQNGGWVGMSDLSPLGNGKFLVLERDNQFGPDAAIKKLYTIDLGDFAMAVPAAGDTVSQKQLEIGNIPTIEKELVLDLIPTLEEVTGAKVVEKLEGCAVTASGVVYINNDNDGVDDNSGEQILLDLGLLFPSDVDSMGPGDTDSNSPAESPEAGDDSGAATSTKYAIFIIVGAVAMLSL